jgi:hypothetical protein
MLGERMFRVKTEGLSTSITRELDNTLDKDHRDILPTNTDILFAPEYGLDVIKLLLQLGRNLRLYLAWPGELVGERLIYSEPETLLPTGLACVNNR